MATDEVALGRLRWGSDLSRSAFGFRSAWNHDYPRAEQHLSLIIRELTLTRIRTDADAVLALDDPDLFAYPIVMMWEPGFWNLTDREADAFRAYLLKGGFAIFEDFDGAEQWRVFEAQMRRVLPDGRLVRLDKSHPIFDSFYRIDALTFQQATYQGLQAKFYGLFEDNDPTKRMLAIVNYDYDVSEYWEYSDEGWFPIDLTNTAYKFGINYMIYSVSR